MNTLSILLRFHRHFLLLVVAGGSLPLAIAGPFRETYTYDDADRLVAVAWEIDGTGASIEVDHDPAGNRIMRTTNGTGGSAGDSDGDGLPDEEELKYFGNLDQTASGDPDADNLSNADELAFGSSPILANTDGDAQDDYTEWIAGTDPADPTSSFQITAVSAEVPVRVSFPSSASRVYTLQSSPALTPDSWTDVAGQVRIPGSGGVDQLSDPNPGSTHFYRVVVEVP